LDKYGLDPDYVFMTCHRDRNTDIKENLVQILTAVASIPYQVILPIHPRTEKAIKEHKLEHLIGDNLIIISPTSFWETQSLLKNAKFTITDSGGVIKEAYFQKVPCIIIDQQTEWIETVEEGWAVVTGPDCKKIISRARSISKPETHSEALGDGHAGKRIVTAVLAYLNK